MSEAALEIRLLGPFQVLRDGRERSFPPSRKARALLGYLVATDRPHSRKHLCDLLWEGPKDPRASLRWALSKIRPLVDDDGTTRLVTDGDRVGFEPRGAHVDLAAVRNATRPRPDTAETAALEAAAGSFRGELLEGLDLPDCLRFDVWCSGRRQEVRDLRDSILATLADRLSGAPKRALPYARQRLLVSPLSESAHAGLVEILGAAGRQREALAKYEAACRILEEELGRKEFPRLDEARRRLTAPSPAPNVDGGASSSAAATPAASAPTGLAPALAAAAAESGSLPLVGRGPERAAMEELIDGTVRREGAAVLLLRGEPGIGKTRLLEELVRRIRGRGGEALVGRGYEAERVRPLGAWIDALRSLPRAAIPGPLHPELAALLPELGATAAEEMDRNRLFDAVIRLLERRAARRAPVGVVLDDAQWLDEVSAALLHYAARATAGSGILLAAAVRPAELSENPAVRRLVSALRREDRLRPLDLPPLEKDEIAELLDGVDPALDPAPIFARSEGNPLFALEMARGQREGEEALPAALEKMIDDRLERLPARARELLPWTAALRRDFRPAVLAEIADPAPASLVSAMEELERHGILRVTHAGGYGFTHDLIRQRAYRRIPEPRRRLIHGRIARTLEDSERAEGERAGEIAHHAARGGDFARAARAFAAAGRYALSVFAWKEVAELAARGLAQAEKLPERLRLPLRLELLGLYVYPEISDRRPPALEEKLLELIDDLRAAGLDAKIPAAHDLIAWIHYGSGEFGQALERMRHVEEAGRESDPATAARAIADTAGCLAMIGRQMGRAEKLAREAKEIAEGLEEEIPAVAMALGLVRQHAGDWEEAIALFERATRAFRRSRETWWEWDCRSRLTMIELERGRYEAALARCGELEEVVSRMEGGSAGPFAEALESLARLALDADGAGTRTARAAEKLREIDSRWMLAYVQAMAAELDAAAGRPETARLRAEDALSAAAVVDRRSERALGRSVLARLAAADGSPAEAATHLEAVREDMAAPRVLSARARAAVSRAGEYLDETPPWIPTLA